MLNLSTIEISVDPPITLRRASNPDFKFIKEVSRAEMGKIVPRSWNWKSWFKDIESQILGNNHKIFVIEVQNTSSGYLWLNEEVNSLWITAIVLQIKHQRRKIGQKIMHFLITESHKEGKEFIELGVQQNNKKALLFYSKLGFEKFDYVRHANTDLIRLKL